MVRFHLGVATTMLALGAWSQPATGELSVPAPRFQNLASNLWVWTDTCNVYVLRSGESALLIDLGEGGVLDALSELGIRRVEWVVFTHHHREQCQGAPPLEGRGARIAAPAAERELLETPTHFRRMNVRLGDPHTIHGASYVRPPVQAVRVDRGLTNNESFVWRGHELRCLSTPGNSPGAMSFELTLEGKRWLFSGDLMLQGARMHTWFDTEWDYGFGAGIVALRRSVSLVEAQSPDVLLPAQGALIDRPAAELREYFLKLERLERLYVRGYGVEAESNAYQDRVSTPTVVSNVWQVSPHLFKFKRPNFWPNFALILAESGRALVVDCGLLDEKFLEEALQGMRQHLGLKGIDAVVVTHMHGDHFLEVPYLRRQWGAAVWGLDRMVGVCEHPEWFDYAAPVQAYGKPGVERLKFDRVFQSGETFEWEGYRFTVDWMPGQTEFALCLHGIIDGRRVAFTGDNLFGDPEDPSQTGHEAVVAHNSAILEEGYIYAGEYLRRLQPDILIGGHSFVMDRPQGLIERFRRWSYEMRDAFRALSSASDYRYWFDPYWVRAEPYRVRLRPGESAEIQIHVRNFRGREQRHAVALAMPTGLMAEPPRIEGLLEPESRGSFPVRLRAAANTPPGVVAVGLDVTLDGIRRGQLFDFICEVLPPR